jgi:hypothetical protein
MLALISGLAGKVQGIFTATQDNTSRVVSERRLKSLHELSLDLTDVEVLDGFAIDSFARSQFSLQGVSHVCEVTAKGLSRNPHDIPFSFLYRSQTSQLGRRLVLERAVGVVSVIFVLASVCFSAFWFRCQVNSVLPSR